MSVFSSALLKAMKSSDETLYRIAKDTGLDYMTVWRFVNGQCGLNLESADRLAEYFGLEVVIPKKKTPK